MVSTFPLRGAMSQGWRWCFASTVGGFDFLALHMKQFNDALKQSHPVDEKIAAFLTSRGATIQSFNHDNKHDISYTKNGKSLTLEVKTDYQWQDTGNVAVEYESRGKSSCICSSVADYWCYVLGEDLCFIKRADLIKDIIKSNYRRVSGGDEHTSRLVLIPLEKFKTIFTVVEGGLSP